MDETRALGRKTRKGVNFRNGPKADLGYGPREDQEAGRSCPFLPASFFPVPEV